MVESSEIVHDGGMRALKIREHSEQEFTALNNGLRSSDAFTVRWCQILLASKEGRKNAPADRVGTEV